MRIFLTGSSGFVGSNLSLYLEENGHEVFKLIREKDFTEKNQAFWDTETGKIESGSIDNSSVIIHLAGANIAGKRWNPDYKQLIQDSRLDSTRKLVDYITNNDIKPTTFICASAIGYYGHRPGEKLQESDSKGVGFLADLTDDWEDVTEPLKKHGIRVVNLRLGMVLGKGGGALQKMLLPFKMGLGGKLGTGSQYMSWVSITDLVRAVEYILHKQQLDGPVNIVSPQAVTNKEFTKSLASAVRRPAFFDVPEFILNLIVGEMAEEMILVDSNVIPFKLVKHGFIFYHKDLKSTLIDLLGKNHGL